MSESLEVLFKLLTQMVGSIIVTYEWSTKICYSFLYQHYSGLWTFWNL